MAATRDNPTQLMDAERSTSARERDGSLLLPVRARVKFAGRWLACLWLSGWWSGLLRRGLRSSQVAEIRVAEGSSTIGPRRVAAAVPTATRPNTAIL